jgi:hypothetical protein
MPLLIVTGHQRSGTTILRILLNSHPEIAVTNELANFKHLRRSRFFYTAYLLRRLLASRERGAAYMLHRNEETPWRENARFLAAYLFRVQASRSWRIGFSDAEDALHALLPGKRWVGDKFPDYIWKLRFFAGSGTVRCIVIYRDARDVVLSTLESVRTKWKGRRYTRLFDTPEKIAARWVKTVRQMDECSADILAVSYERLIAEPKAVAQELGIALDVDPAYFPVHLLRNTSVGKHRGRLTGGDLAAVESIAGETLARLGYPRTDG